MSFVERIISVSFTLQNGVFSESGTNTLTVSGLRASAKIIKAGGGGLPDLNLQVWGMTLSTMNQISTLGMRLKLVPQNKVIVSAGDASGMTIVYAGNIVDAYIDYETPAAAKLNLQAQSGAFDMAHNAAPTSYDGSVDVAEVLSSLATLIGVPFQNNGVSVILDHPYFFGSARDQAYEAVRAANIEWNALEDQTLSIWPKGGNRGGQVPLISGDTGMRNYPSYAAGGIVVKTLFNPSIGFGSQVQVESILPRASGLWTVYRLDHDLESILPEGQWFSTVYCYNPEWGSAPLS